MPEKEPLGGPPNLDPFRRGVGRGASAFVITMITIIKMIYMIMMITIISAIS